MDIYGNFPLFHQCVWIMDIICLILNVYQRIFKIVVNEDETNSAEIHDVRIKGAKYKLAVTLSHPCHKVQLIKYQIE